jgi:hypothetical protein
MLMSWTRKRKRKRKRTKDEEHPGAEEVGDVDATAQSALERTTKSLSSTMKGKAKTKPAAAGAQSASPATLSRDDALSPDALPTDADDMMETSRLLQSLRSTGTPKGKGKGKPTLMSPHVMAAHLAREQVLSPEALAERADRDARGESRADTPGGEHSLSSTLKRKVKVKPPAIDTAHGAAPARLSREEWTSPANSLDRDVAAILRERLRGDDASEEVASTTGSMSTTTRRRLAKEKPTAVTPGGTVASSLSREQALTPGATPTHGSFSSERPGTGDQDSQQALSSTLKRRQGKAKPATVDTSGAAPARLARDDVLSRSGALSGTTAESSDEDDGTVEEQTLDQTTHSLSSTLKRKIKEKPSAVHVHGAQPARLVRDDALSPLIDASVAAGDAAQSPMVPRSRKPKDKPTAVNPRGAAPLVLPHDDTFVSAHSTADSIPGIAVTEAGSHSLAAVLHSRQQQQEQQLQQQQPREQRHVQVERSAAGAETPPRSVDSGSPAASADESQLRSERATAEKAQRDRRVASSAADSQQRTPFEPGATGDAAALADSKQRALLSSFERDAVYDAETHDRAAVEVAERQERTLLGHHAVATVEGVRRGSWVAVENHERVPFIRWFELLSLATRETSARIEIAGAWRLRFLRWQLSATQELEAVVRAQLHHAAAYGHHTAAERCRSGVTRIAARDFIFAAECNARRDMQAAHARVLLSTFEQHEAGRRAHIIRGAFARLLDEVSLSSAWVQRRRLVERRIAEGVKALETAERFNRTATETGMLSTLRQLYRNVAVAHHGSATHHTIFATSYTGIPAFSATDRAVSHASMEVCEGPRFASVRTSQRAWSFESHASDAMSAHSRLSLTRFIGRTGVASPRALSRTPRRFEFHDLSVERAGTADDVAATASPPPTAPVPQASASLPAFETIPRLSIVTNDDDLDGDDSPASPSRKLPPVEATFAAAPLANRKARSAAMRRWAADQTF